MLSAAQIERYQRDGYLVLPGFKSDAAIAALRERALQIVEAFEPSTQQSIFSTSDQARTANAEFLASADGVHCFFEEEAFDAQRRLRQAKSLSINKIGHAMHDLDAVFERFSHGPELASLATDLGLAKPQLWQSMYIFKPPGIGGEVKWHQDATFLDTTPCTVTGFWFALEAATQDNGCLWVQPGGQLGPLRERFVRQGDAVAMQVLDTSPWPDASSAVPVEVDAGALVCFHGLLPHYSAPNRSAQSRHAYTLHAVDASSRWSPSNWMRRRESLALRGFV